MKHARSMHQQHPVMLKNHNTVRPTLKYVLPLTILVNCMLSQYNYKEMDSIAIKHYLTKIHIQKRKKRKSLCVRRYKQMLASSLLVVNSLACLAAPWGHIPTNHVRLVSWHYPFSKLWSPDCGGLGLPSCLIRIFHLIKLLNTSFKF